MTEEQIRGILSGVSEFAYLRSLPEDTMLTKQLTSKREIWRSLIWFSFLVIGIEFLFSTLRPQRELEPITAGSKSLQGSNGLIRRWFRFLFQIMGGTKSPTRSSAKGI